LIFQSVSLNIGQRFNPAQSINCLERRAWRPGRIEYGKKADTRAQSRAATGTMRFTQCGL